MSLHYEHKDVLEYFETPEGTYKLKSVLSPKCLPGIPATGRLSSVHLSFCDSRSVCCINSGRDICIYPIPGCRMYDSHTPGKQTFKTSAPVCHDFGVSSLLLMGFAGGEIHMIDPFQKELCKAFNEEKYIERSPVTCIRWVPYSTNQFLVAHSSGHMYLYNDDLSCCPAPPVYQLFKKGSSYVVFTCKTKSTCNPLYNWALTNVLADISQSKIFEDCDISTAPLASINQFAFSTCGKYLAVVTEDGYLRVFDYHRMQLYGFMRSYFGGLTCVDWSPDGKYVVVGGQDDLITIWSFAAQAVICRGQGHKSWTSVVRFDPFVYPPSICNGGGVSNDLATSTSNSASNDHRGGGLQTGTTTSAASSALNSNSNGDSQSLLRHQLSQHSESDSPFRTYRLGSVGQDTFLCLWELTEDIIRQGLRFSAHYHHSTGGGASSGRHPSGALSVISTASVATCSGVTEGALVDGSTSLEKSRTVPRSNAGSSTTSKKKAFLSSFRSSLPHSSRHQSEHGDFSAKSSMLSENGLMSLTRDGVNGNHHLSISSRDLLGTPNCPRLSDVPVLEPFAKFGITRDLITDLVFREDSINLAFQQGVILSYTRPQVEACSNSAAAGDLSIFDTANLIGDVGEGIVDDVEEFSEGTGRVDVDGAELEVGSSSPPFHVHSGDSPVSNASGTSNIAPNSHQLSLQHNPHMRHHALSHRLNSRSPFIPESSAGQAL
ncbi:unnamed protein product [Hymenolepis diminuta]|uniref:WD_REPEATS_REGION domain-containing protein n=1 Tax=Hymenolepis diminuta TaxID=6216 RepID=A0A158QCZ7_HYMDI|nr:unnamed protein product [Hymenolepis diminuta]VUZ42325.1 unnamed protein product [Hymenolepis diminuta]